MKLINEIFIMVSISVSSAIAGLQIGNAIRGATMDIQLLALAVAITLLALYKKER